MKSLISAILAATIGVAVAAPIPAQTSKQKLKKALRDNDVAASWIYDDIDAGFAESRRMGKPMLVIFRCVP